MNLVNNFFQASLNNFQILQPETQRYKVGSKDLSSILQTFKPLDPRELSARMALARSANRDFTLAPQEQKTLFTYLDEVVNLIPPEQRIALLIPCNRETAISVLVEPARKPVIAFLNNSLDNPLITRYDPSGEPSLMIKPLTKQAGVEVDPTKDFYKHLADLIIKLEERSSSSNIVNDPAFQEMKTYIEALAKSLQLMHGADEYLPIRMQHPSDREAEIRFSFHPNGSLSKMLIQPPIIREREAINPDFLVIAQPKIVLPEA
ncbi:MAG: hypothetical protein VKK32_04220 [Candidatus Melainabacteria bacterium]|nr:hypothetical protein [Candidatus Melainabacteria bacterium]